MVYDLPVADEKIKPHQVTALHLMAAMAFIGSGAIILKYNYQIPMWGLALLLFGLALAVFTIAKNKLLVSKKVNIPVRLVELTVSLAMLALSLKEGWKFPIVIFGILCGVLLFAILWERTAGTNLFVHIADEGIKLPVTSRKRFLPWTQIEQVVYRFGTLSIDCVDNTLYQWDISGKTTGHETVEAFCSDKVEENRDKRAKDW